MTSSVVGLRSSKPFPKSKPAPKKFMSTVWWSAANLIHCSFLNPGKTITSEKCAQQIDMMHKNLQHLQPALFNKVGPILPHDNAWPQVAQPTLQKLNELVYEVLPHPPYSPDLSPTDCHFFKHLKNLLQGKCFPRVRQILRHGFLCYWNKQTFLVGKNVWIVMAPILIKRCIWA